MSTILYQSFSPSESDALYLQHFHTTLLDESELFVSFALTDFFEARDGKILFDLIKNTAFDYLIAGKSLPSYERFEEVLKYVNDEIKLYLTRKDDHYVGEIHATVGFLSRDEFHISKIGLAQCYLLRKGDVVDISEGLYDPTKDTGEYFVNIASGVLKKHDKVVFVTSPLLRHVPLQELTSIFATSDIQSSLLELETALEKQDAHPMMVSAFVVQRDPALPFAEAEQQEQERSAQTFSVRDFASGVRKRAGTVLRKEDSRKLLIIGAVVVVVVLAVSVLSLFGNQKNNEVLARYAQMLEEAQQEINAARTEATSSNRERAKQLLGEARTKLTELRDDQVFIDNVDELLEMIRHEEAQMDNIELLAEPRVFADLTEILGGEQIKNMINTSRGMYVYTDRSVIGPVLDGNTSSFVKQTLPNGSTIVSGDRFTDRGGLVFLLEPNKLAEFVNGAFELMDTADVSWKNGDIVRTFAERNFVYLLDSVENQIWRYRRMNTDYSAASGWVTQTEDRTLIDSDVVSFAIDGFIYVLKKDGSIYKFYDGKRSTPFAYADLPSEPLQNLDAQSQIYVRTNLRRIYVLDHAKSRILVFRKDPILDVRLLRYERQFQFPGKDIRGLTVNDDEITMYITDPTTLYKIDL